MLRALDIKLPFFFFRLLVYIFIRYIHDHTVALLYAGKFPTLVSHQESLESKVNETKATVKFQLKKVLCMGVAVGNCSMEEKQIFQNVQMSVNFLVSLLKKNWQNVSITTNISITDRPVCQHLILTCILCGPITCE